MPFIYEKLPLLHPDQLYKLIPTITDRVLRRLANGITLMITRYVNRHDFRKGRHLIDSSNVAKLDIPDCPKIQIGISYKLWINLSISANGLTSIVPETRYIITKSFIVINYTKYRTQYIPGEYQFNTDVSPTAWTQHYDQILILMDMGYKIFQYGHKKLNINLLCNCLPSSGEV